MFAHDINIKGNTLSMADIEEPRILLLGKGMSRGFFQ